MSKAMFSQYFHKPRAFRLKVFLEGLLVGVLAGMAVIAYRIIINRSTPLRADIYERISAGDWRTGLYYFAALLMAGYITGLLVERIPMIKGSGIPQVKGALVRQFEMKWYQELPAKFLGGILALGFGLSLGREGPSIQIGAEVGSGLGKSLKLHHTEEKYMITSGASAGLAAAFNAPLAGVIFALEELHRNFSPFVLACVMSASLAADFVSKQVFGLGPAFVFQEVTPLPLKHYPYLIGLGIVAGLLGMLFNKALYTSQDLYGKLKPLPTRYTMLIPFLGAGLMGLILPEMLGGGHELIELLSHNYFPIYVLILYVIVKIAFTAFCYGPGTPGGIFLPLLVVGALVGKLYGELLTQYLNVDSVYIINFLILGMAAYFTAIVRAPITGAILILEMTNSFQHLLALMTVSLIAFVLTDVMASKPIYEGLLERMLSNHQRMDLYGGSHQKVIMEIPVAMNAPLEYKQVRDIKWPKDSLLVSIKRGEAEVIPRGETKIYPGDMLLVLCDAEQEAEIKPILLQLGEEAEDGFTGNPT